MRGLLQIRPLHLRTFRTIILSTKGSRRHAAEIALIPHGESPAKPRDNPLNLIRLGPAEGWLLVNDGRQFSQSLQRPNTADGGSRPARAVVAARFGLKKARA
jgi:hypothetical protein